MKDFDRILEELDWPPVFMLSPRQFEQIDGDTLRYPDGSHAAGNSNGKYSIITVSPALRGRERRNTIYHEIAHILFPHRQHWWIEAFAQRMARGGGTGYYCHQTGHGADELPPRVKLLDLARRAARREKERFERRRRRPCSGK